MLTLYLVCLLLGGVLLALALFGGGEADADVDVSVDADVSTDAGDVGAETDGESIVAVARFLSLRNLVFFAAFFGLTGTLLTLVAAGTVLTLITSLVFGVAAGLAVDRVMSYLKRSESGTPPSLGVLAGAAARVVVSIDATHSGKIAVETEDRTHQLVARRHDKAAVERFAAGDTVVIVRFQDGVALVAEPTFLA